MNRRTTVLNVAAIFLATFASGEKVETQTSSSRTTVRARLVERSQPPLADQLLAVQAPSGLNSAGCNPDNVPNVVCTTLGAVRGALEGETVAFKGLPYAQPPIGDLRWRAPQPAAPWQGQRDATAFGPICPQVQNRTVIGDEDCLTLNVWAPREESDQPLPVMVYLTGGGNHSQSGQGSGRVIFNGARLVPERVILVTFNIRLGVLGFLTHPVLDAERSEHVSGNYGNLDQIAMLRWLRANAEAFGGDPNRIVLFGTSAGGANVCGLLTSPFAKGLFHAASMQSSVPTGCEFLTLAQAQSRTGLRLAQTVGCNTAECLRSTPVAELVLAVEAVTNLFPRTYGPVVDGYVFPDQPLQRIRDGLAARVPVIIGNTAEETSSWADGVVQVTDADSYSTGVERVFGAALRDRVLAEYPIASYPTPRAAFVRATTDAMFMCQSRRVARAMVGSGGGPVYRYIFTHALENNPDVGVPHSYEYPFFFTFRTYSPGDSDRRVAQQMVTFWTQLAKTGRPVSTDGAAWAPVTVQEASYIEIGPAMFPAGAADARCDFWDLVRLPSPHL